MAVPNSNFRAGTAALPSSKVEISVSCRKLRDLDILSKSDPMCVLFIQDIQSQRYIEIGRTETINNNLNPDFVKHFVVDYFFEECQRLKFQIFDVDTSSQSLSQQDFIGEVDLTLGEMVGAPGGCVKKSLTNKNLPGTSCGEILLRVEELGSNKEIITLYAKGTELDQKNWWGLFGKSDPFLTFYRANEDNSFTIVHKTEEIKNTLNPNWKPFTVPLKTFCNGDHDRTIKVQCYDWNASGNHEFIGEFFTNVRELSSNQARTFELKNPKSRKKKDSGKIHIHGAIEVENTFIDYIRGGMQMNFTVAIDFTASNGNPQSPESLHYLNPYCPNQYASAVTAVGEIIQDYDSDNMFPALGFGARMPDGSVSHEFPLNFEPSNPFCPGVQGVLNAYYQALSRVQLYGPTNFAPVINHVARFAAAVRDGTEYFVLLIITDGIITDMPQTKAAIVQASTLPMSIIIVGVGNADFTEMNILDGDVERLSYQGRVAERDIVQFVPFRNFLTTGSNMKVANAYLAKEVLAEVPDQILSYMKRYNIKPKPPLPSSVSNGRSSHFSNIPQEPPPPYSS
ncbi:copine-9 [Biomphalaria glabrata]|nr:copine-9 [Biomphalaria glabrata]